MVYISNGAVVSKRSPWRFSIIVDFLLALMGMLTIFWRTLFDPAAAASARAGSGSSSSRNNSNRRGGGGGGRSGGGRIVGMDTLNKADHNARCGGGG